VPRHVRHSQNRSTRHPNEDDLQGVELGLVPRSQQLSDSVHDGPASLREEHEHQAKIPFIEGFERMFDSAVAVRTCWVTFVKSVLLVLRDWLGLDFLQVVVGLR